GGGLGRRDDPHLRHAGVRRRRSAARSRVLDSRAVMRELLKATAHAAATAIVAPALVSYALRARILGRDRALEGSTQALALVPGLVGEYLRRAFLARVLAGCDRTAVISFGTVFSQAGARIDAHAYIGPRCHLGLVHVGRDAL